MRHKSASAHTDIQDLSTEAVSVVPDLGLPSPGLYPDPQLGQGPGLPAWTVKALFNKDFRQGPGRVA